MGPTNTALARLYVADQKLREALGRLDEATKKVRIQQRRVADLGEKLRQAQQTHRELQARSRVLDTELKSRDLRIEKLRSHQQQARNNKEYQASLVEINTLKVDRKKVEDEAILILKRLEEIQVEIAAATTAQQGEQAKLVEMQGSIDQTTLALREEVESLRKPRDEAYQALDAKARVAFDRLSERFDGEALSALDKPDRRVEGYSCTACNIDLVRDVYNRLHTSDELVFCRSCGRILYIPDALPPEVAVHRPKEIKKKDADAAEKKPRKSGPRKAATAAETSPEESPAEPVSDQAGVIAASGDDQDSPTGQG